VKVAAAVKWPGAIHEGNGTMVVFIDANEDQRDPVVSILTAQDPGLPWEILAATVSDVHGPFFEPIEITDSETDSHVRVPDKFEIQMQSFTNPVTNEKHEVHLPCFTPDRIAALEPQIRQLCGELLTKMRKAGGGDFATD
jgi:hypothetical protein